MVSFVLRKLPVGECYRYDASVGFCHATTEVIRATPFEIELKLWRPQKRKLFVGRLTRSLPLTRPPACPSMSLGTRRLHSAKRRSKVASAAADALQSDKYAYNWIKPRRVAFATASVRLITLSLAKMLFTCDFTVPSLIKRAEPISLLLLPCAISLRTSISRSLNVSPLTRCASLAARCTGTQVSPACTRRMQSINASRGASLSR